MLLSRSDIALHSVLVATSLACDSFTPEPHSTSSNSIHYHTMPIANGYKGPIPIVKGRRKSIPIINGHDNTETIFNGQRTARRTPHILNVLEQRYHARFYQSIASIMALRASFLRDRHIFVRGEDMVPILKGLGAREDDFEFVKQISDLTGPDPTLDYRTVTYGRYCLDPEKRRIRRLAAQPYTLTVQEDYKRHDSGISRTFNKTPLEMQGNTVVQALLLFKSLIFQNVRTTPRAGLDYTSPSWGMHHVQRAHTHLGLQRHLRRTCARRRAQRR